MSHDRNFGRRRMADSQATLVALRGAISVSHGEETELDLAIKGQYGHTIRFYPKLYLRGVVG
jgi:hypothetical protein